MSSNKLIIAAAGSGKTTHLVKEALKQKNGRILITTYTDANEAEIRKKIYKEAGCIPKNIVVQTWFSFLLQHGVRPFQGCLYDEQIKGMLLVNKRSGFRYKNKQGFPVYFKETDTRNFYLSINQKIYSDKISKFTTKCNELNDGAVISRLSKIFSHMFIDEVQDLACYDLDLLKLLFESKIDVFMVGDPRQVVYVTHHARRLGKYSDGKIVGFIADKCQEIAINVDETTLRYSHRNNAAICSLASKIYPDFPPCEPCHCASCRVTSPHYGIYLVKEEDVQIYLETYKLMQLRLKFTTKGVNHSFPAINFGKSKGQSFDRVLIFPTVGMQRWLANNKHVLASKTRAQFYVGITRARKSVGIVYNFDKNTNIEDIQMYIPG